jgi:hypothetical protein
MTEFHQASAADVARPQNRQTPGLFGRLPLAFLGEIGSINDQRVTRRRRGVFPSFRLGRSA